MVREIIFLDASVNTRQCVSPLSTSPVCVRGSVHCVPASGSPFCRSMLRDVCAHVFLKGGLGHLLPRELHKLANLQRSFLSVSEETFERGVDTVTFEAGCSQAETNLPTRELLLAIHPHKTLNPQGLNRWDRIKPSRHEVCEWSIVQIADWKKWKNITSKNVIEILFWKKSEYARSKNSREKSKKILGRKYLEKRKVIKDQIIKKMFLKTSRVEKCCGKKSIFFF